MLNQSIRYTTNGGPNNPQGLYDFIKPMRKLKGSGAPAANLGENHWEYLDEVSGIDYVKSNGVWEPYADYSSFAPAPADPLTLNQLNVNTIRGNASDDVLIDAGTGICQVLNQFQVGQVGALDNVQIQDNGNIFAGSLVRSFNVKSWDGAQSEIEINAFNEKIVQNGPAKNLEVQAVAGNVSLNGSTGLSLNANGNGVDCNNEALNNVNQVSGSGLVLGLSANTSLVFQETATNKLINVDPAEASISNNSNGTFTIKHLTTGEDVELQAEQTGPGNVRLRPGPSGQAECTGRLSMQGQDVKDCKGLNSALGQALVVEHLVSNQNVEVKCAAAGAGNLILRSGNSGQIVHNTPATFNPFGLETSSINSSETYTQAKALLTTNTGQLTWGEPWRTITFNKVNIAAATATVYLDIAGLSVNPADVSCFPILENPVYIRRVSSILISSAPWSFNGGTANLEIGYIPLGSPCTDANFVSITVLPINTAADYYYSLSRPNLSITTGKLAVRLVTNGTAPTSGQAELVVDVMVGG